MKKPEEKIYPLGTLTLSTRERRLYLEYRAINGNPFIHNRIKMRLITYFGEAITHCILNDSTRSNSSDYSYLLVEFFVRDDSLILERSMLLAENVGLVLDIT